VCLDATHDTDRDRTCTAGDDVSPCEHNSAHGARSPAPYAAVPVTNGTDPALRTANDALRAADWSQAATLYLAVLDGDGDDVAEAWFGLGVASWWQGDVTRSLECWERAHAAFRRAGNDAQAVVAAFYLCLSFRMSLGNEAAASGWLQRAAALVDESDLTSVAGWVALARAYIANDNHDPAAAADLAGHAIALAKELGDRDLALCATSELGFALVALGDVDAGGSLLDEAMAAALGGDRDDLDSVVLVSCRTITACRQAFQLKRAAQWISAADTFQRTYGSTHLFTACKTHHGAVLFAAGDWAGAEAELELALHSSDAAESALRADATAVLSELRIAQGRFDDAHRLLDSVADQPVTSVAQARLQLATGRASTAASLARRRLRQLSRQEPERVVLLDLLAEASPTDGPPVVDEAPLTGVAAAYWSRAAGRAALGAGGADALARLEDALAGFAAAEMSYECARTRALLAEATSGTDRDLAVREAGIALSTFDGLGASREADAVAAFLRACGVRAVRAAPKGLGLLTRREREVLGLLGEGLSNPAISERLYVSRRTVEAHVSSVLRKLGLTGRAEAAAYTARLGRDTFAPK
jgi:DNA-binding CsgD family transcriptional regulator/tetratricopeptide (TPR) repeat protein